jgi:hypothetical protein
VIELADGSNLAQVTESVALEPGRYSPGGRSGPTSEESCARYRARIGGNDELARRIFLESSSLPKSDTPFRECLTWGLLGCLQFLSRGAAKAHCRGREPPEPISREPQSRGAATASLRRWFAVAAPRLSCWDSFTTGGSRPRCYTHLSSPSLGASSGILVAIELERTFLCQPFLCLLSWSAATKAVW